MTSIGRAFRLVAAFAVIVALNLPAGHLSAQSSGGAAARRPAPAAVPPPNAGKAGKKGTATEQQAGPTPPPKIGSINDLCRVREREILFHAGNVLALTADYRKEADAVKKDALMRSLQNEKQFANYVEQSWERLDCQVLLYGSPGFRGGR